MTSPPPDLGSLRIAAPADVLRIGLVATAGFIYSPVFRWERPHHKQYPEDTLLSFRTQLQDAMKSDDFIVLVREDAYDPQEDDKTVAVIPSDNGWERPEAGAKVVVGVITIQLEPNSARRGQVKDHRGSYPDLPYNHGRDLNRRHYDSWGALVAATREEYKLHSDSIVTMLVVHPAYWSRGHGTRLAAWARDLSKNDKIPQCVSCTTMSRGIFASLGFRKLCSITAAGDEDDKEGVHADLMEFGGVTAPESV